MIIEPRFKNFTFDQKIFFSFFISSFLVVLSIWYFKYYLFVGFNPGFARIFYWGVFYFVFFLKYNLYISESKYIILFVVFTFIGSLYSLDPIAGLDRASRHFFGYLVFIIAYFFVDDIKSLKFLMKIYLLGLILFELNVPLSILSGIGQTGYDESGGGVLFGGAGEGSTKFILLFLIMSPLYSIFIDSKRKFLTNVALSIAPLIILISVKRGVILAMIIVLLSQFFLPLKEQRWKLLGSYVFIALSVFIFQDLITTRVMSREKIFEATFTGRSMELEARGIETTQTLDAFEKGDLLVKLFGHGTYSERVFFNTYRMHHIDFNALLFGGGVLGVFLYYMMFIKIIFSARRIIKIYRIQKIAYNLLIVTSIVLIVMGSSGTIHGVDLPFIAFTNLAVCLKLIKHPERFIITTESQE